jgi:peptide/nickel transport system substrate-binding protein
MERNPYFWQVDTEGNQLPYIDSIEHALYQQADVFNLWIAGGKIDEQGRGTSVGAYTFYKENEQKGGYRTFRWRAASTDAYYPNITCPDKVLAKLFDTADFRQALSIAIDRKAINDLVWTGLGKPRQASPIVGSPEYDAELEQKWAEYDPAKANQLLDGLGLTKNPDGTRRRPDGQVLEVTVEHTSIAGSPDEDAHNQVKRYWEAIGVKTNMKFLERSLYQERNNNAEIQIGYWSFDRCSVVKADPGRWTGQINDGPWAPAYGHFYDQNSFRKEEPPADHPIREIWRLWEQCQAEADEAKRNATFQQLIGVHKRHPYAIGTVGEKVAPYIVRTNFRNFLDGFIHDDTLRDDGLLNPAQFFIKK